MNTSKQIAQQLEEVPAGFLQQDLFNQIARLGVLAYIELLAFRLNSNNEVEVLLTMRDAADEFWPNMYHNPGTVLRPNDSDLSFKSAIDRLMVDEYGGQKPEQGPYFAGLWFEQLERGKGLGIISWMELNECPVGEYFPVDDLPESMITSQDVYIKNAANTYYDYKCGKFNPTPLQQLILQ